MKDAIATGEAICTCEEMHTPTANEEKSEGKQMEKENVVGIVGVITETPKLILEAPDWTKKVYETKIEAPRRSGTMDTLILQFSGKAAGTKKQLSKLKKGTEILVAGAVRTHNVRDRVPTEPSVKIYIEAEVVEVNDPPADQQNEVLLKGNISREPVPRMTSGGTHITNIIVAVSNGNKAADFVPCICWQNVADAAAKLKKGSYVEVTGRMQSREFKKVVNDMPCLMTAYEVSVIQLGVDQADMEAASGGEGKE